MRVCLATLEISQVLRPGVLLKTMNTDNCHAWSSADPFLDGILRLHTPLDIHVVVRFVAVGLDTRWILE